MTEKTLSRIGFEAYDKVLRIQIFGKDFDPEVIPVGEDVEAWDAAAQAIIDAHEARKWRDIESAPTDTYILCLEPDGVMSVMYLCSIDGRWTLSSDNRSSPMYEPTLWQPLPAPPKQGD